MTLSQDDLDRLSNNPSRGLALIVNEIENNWFEGKALLNSKSHPAVMCLDTILATTHGFQNRLSDALAKKFAVHARNLTELTMNMSDEERIGFLADPATMAFQFIIEENTLQAIAVESKETFGRITANYRKIVIPKDTLVDVAGYMFAIENGIEIRYNDRTGYQVVYDSSTNNPWNPIQANVLDRVLDELNGRRYLAVTVPVRQLTYVAYENINSTAGGGCRGEVDFNDYFYGARAFLTGLNGDVKEMKVAYDQYAFDPQVPTLTLTLDTVNKTLAYEIPDVYIQNESGLGSLQLVVWTTKGELVKDLTNVSLNEIVPNYRDLRFTGSELSEYSAPLRNSGGIAWKPMTVVSGGKNPTDFSILKRSVIDGRRQRNLPITESNLTGEVDKYGYEGVKAIDYLTGRQYALTKELPLQVNKKLASSMSCFVGSHLTSINDLIVSGVVYDNDDRVTLPPDVLFDINTPTVKLINQLTKQRYLGLSPEAKVDLINKNSMVYTPFYTVFDLTNNQATIRTYHLDEPTINYQNFKSENPTLGLELGVGTIKIDHQDDGYLITISSKSGKSYKDLDDTQVGLQLSFQPTDSYSLASMAGTYIGKTEDGERVWQFKLETKFDVDVNDVLYITNMNQFGSKQLRTGIKLVDDLIFIFTVNGNAQYAQTESDEKIDNSLYPDPVMAIIETHYQVQLGMALKNMYNRIRPLVGEAQYQRYKFDVPAVYESNVYKRDDKGQLVFDEKGRKILVHSAGDQQFTSNGEPILQYRKNDIMYDPETKEPIELLPRDLKYHWDFIGFDGAYFFSTDSYDKQFAQETKDYFIDTINKEMVELGKSALDRTNLYYQPKNKLGYRNVMVNNNYETVLKQDMAFAITYYLNKTGFGNQNLKDALTESTPTTINNALLNNTTIGVSDLVTALRQDAGTDVVDVEVGALAGDTTVDVMSSIDALSGFSVRKELETGTDGLLSVKEKIDVIFLLHDPTKKY